MQDLAAIIRTIPSFAVWLFLGMTALGIAVQTFPHWRQGYHRWRLSRRMVQSDFILADEQNAFERAIGDELERADWPEMLGMIMLNAAIAAAGVWAHEAGQDGWWLVASFGVLALTSLFSLWRRVNDPEKPPISFSGPDAVVPPEAIAGFVGAVSCILFFAAFIYFF